MKTDNNFVGVFPLNYMNKFIDHATMVSKKKYQFIIASTDSSNMGGTHWQSILDSEPKTDISFGLDLMV